MSKIFQAGLLAALVASVAGHTSVKKFQAGGKTYDGYYQDGLRDPGNKSPAWWNDQGWGWLPVYGNKINHPDIIAQKDAVPSPYTVEAPAGQDVTFTWAHEGACGSETGWDCSHHGFTATYLAPCNGDCKDVVKTDLKFFKIHDSALIDYRSGRYSQGSPKGQTGYWATDKIFYDNGNRQSVTIPKGIPSGNYVLRTEVMSIHNNGDVSQRQFWPQAFNIKVTGGTGSKVPEGKKGTELYSVNDALLKWDLYQHGAGAIVAAPGPAVASVASANARRSHPRDFSS